MSANSNIYYYDINKLKMEASQLLEKGQRLYTQGKTYQEKEEGVSILLQGTRQLKLWIDNEQNYQTKQQIIDSYNQKMQQIEQYLAYLETIKPKKVVNPNPQVQQQNSKPTEPMISENAPISQPSQNTSYGINTNQYISVDNFQIRKEVNNLFDQGNFYYSKGKTLDEKEQGVKLLLQGTQKLTIWITRENDPQQKAILQQNYNNKMKEIEQYMTYINAQKQQQDNPQAMVNGGDKGGKASDNENDKFKNALQEAIVTEKPNVKWDDISGLENAKKSLQEAVILPIKFPDIFKGARKPWKGILLYGPPGTGKTFLAKACATEADGTFFSISSSDLVSKYVGESEKLIRTLFNMAREKKPAIIFIDEIDSLCGARSDNENEASRRIKTEFLVQMQGVGKDDEGILVLGATNLPWALDPAIRRRFEKRIYIPLPEEQARESMIKKNLGKTDNEVKDKDIQYIAQQTDGYSGSDISILVRDAIMEPVRKLQEAKQFELFNYNGKKLYKPVDGNQKGPNIKQMDYLQLKQEELYIPPVTGEDFIRALKKARPSVSHEQLKEYEKFTKDFGQDG